MACVRDRDNRSTELRLIALFRANGIAGWRRHRPMHGKPDFVFPERRVVVFADGCFWHGCPKHGTLPVARRAYWSTKIARNRVRDREVNRRLRAQGWRVLRIWEHALTRQHVTRTAARLRRELGGQT